MTRQVDDARQSGVGQPSWGKIVVVIVNYNAADRIARLLATLAGTPVSAVSIVDNGSAPADRLSLKQVAERYEWVKVDEAGTNLGFGAGVNRAVSNLVLEPEDQIWILNPDTEVYADAPRQLAQTLRAGEADIVSPLILQGPQDSPLIYFAGGRIDWWRGRSTHEMSDQAPSLARPGVNRTEFVTGAAPMMTAATWGRLGGFREDYFLYWEDADLSVRAGLLGLRCAVDTDAVIWHDGLGASSEHGRHRAYYWHNARNRRRFLSEWQPKEPSIDARLARASETARLGVRALLEHEQPLSKFVSVLAGRFGDAPWDDAATASETLWRLALHGTRRAGALIAAAKSRSRTVRFKR